MLRRWSIDNFKSFGDRTDIDLASISIFAGANSSGKSSIIQTILLLKQTIQYTPGNRPITLNGPLLKLGTFNDVKNSGSSSPEIGIGFEIEIDQIRNPVPLPVHSASGPVTFESVAGEFRWDIGTETRTPDDSRFSDDLSQLQPRLFSASLRTARQSSYVATIATDRPAPQSADLGTFPSAGTYEIIHIDGWIKDELLHSKPDGLIIGATHHHFFPAQVTVRYDHAKERAHRIAALICVEDAAYRWPEIGKEAVQIPKRVADIVWTWLAPKDAPVELFPKVSNDEVSLESLIDLRRRLRLYTDQHRLRPRSANARRRSVKRSSTPKHSADLRGRIQEILEETFKGEGTNQTEIDVTIPGPIAQAIEYLKNYFIYRVHYLGPLRDEPKPIYPLEALANITDVGFRGEYTAAILDLHKDRKIEYLPSAYVSSPHSREKKICTVHDAVVDWLRYLSIASDVRTSDTGKFGHQLKVKSEGLQKYYDLTNVGVGVSQVLPIVVMSLIAESSSLLIFEQPELHLHPKVQARLADFFLSIALSGKQCILETHSEYLIERFRRRIAEAESDALINVVKIYFTEKIAEVTKCRQVTVSKYGAIADWPKDFFDQAQYETQQILKAAASKRASERSK